MYVETYLVGGAVRDALLGLDVTERDWVVVGASPEELLKLNYRPVGKDFPVFLHPQTGEEYALARTERKTAPGYHGFVFHADSTVSLEEDLKRRDFTINAIAQNSNGDFTDPYGGQLDLENKIIRHVSDAFVEDPVRILRAARFLARFQHLGFVIHSSTMELMKTMVQLGEANALTPERCWQECEKALGCQNPEAFFECLHSVGAVSDVLSLESAANFEKAVKSLARVAQEETDSIERFVSFTHFLSEQELSTLCSTLKIPNSYKDRAELNANFSQFIFEENEKSADNFCKILQKLDVQRKPDRFIKALTIFQKLTQQNPEPFFDLWESLNQAFCSVDVKLLIDQGYEKAELGHAIKNARIKAIENVLCKK